MPVAPTDEAAPRLPFKPEDAIRTLAEASKRRFVPTKLNRGQAIHAQRLIRAHPSVDEWRLVGEWLAAGGESWKTELDARALGNFEAWLGHATKWHSDGRPAVGRSPPSARTSLGMSTSVNQESRERRVWK
jgi:hypothetical protein